VKESLIDAVHDTGGEEGFMILRRKKLAGLAVEFFTAVGLIGHKREEAIIVNASDEVRFSVLKLTKIVKGEVDPVAV